VQFVDPEQIPAGIAIPSADSIHTLWCCKVTRQYRSIMS